MQFLILISAMSNTFAWNNGTSSGNFNPNNPDEIATWKNDHYGTHDWIAEAALDAVKADNNALWNDKDGISFWNERREIIFFAGTEAPDVVDFETKRGGWIRTTLNNKKVGGEKTSWKHHIWFYLDDDPRTSRSMKMSNAPIVGLIDDYKEDVVKALIKGQCDLAAFYMGYVVHLISDLANWAHVIEPVDIFNSWDEYPNLPSRPSLNFIESDLTKKHRDFEVDVNFYTSSHKSRTYFFDHPVIGEDGYDSIGVPNDPRVIAVTLAFETRFNTPITVLDFLKDIVPPGVQEGEYEAIWMYHNFKGNKYWTSGSDSKDSVQNALNLAVKAAAQVIKYFGFRWNLDTDRECLGNVVDPEPPQSMSLSRVLMIAITIYIMMGIAMSIALPLTHIVMFKEVLTPAT